MYCLESITASHPLVAPIAERRVKTGTNRDSKSARKAAGSLRKGYQLFFDIVFFSTRDAFPVSRESRIFWRLQNISGPGTSRVEHEIYRATRTRIYARKRRRRAEEDAEGYTERTESGA